MNIILDHFGAWLAAAGVTIVTVFSDKLIARIKFRVNRADLRMKYFEELAIDLSTYVFFAEIFHERYQRGWTSNPDDLEAVGSEVNGAITTLRKKEYVYRAWARKYWGSKEMQLLVQVMAATRSVDDAIHAFNDPGNESEKTAALGLELDKLRKRADEWLSQ